MSDTKERARAFLADLNALLNKHGVELDGGGPENGLSVEVDDAYFDLYRETAENNAWELYDDYKARQPQPMTEYQREMVARWLAGLEARQRLNRT